MSAADPPTLPQAGESPTVAIPRLLELHGDRLYAISRRLCGNPADAEDLVQEVFLQAYRKWDQFDGRSSPTTWLYTIAARTCGRMRRRRAGEPDNIESLDELLPFGDPRIADIPADADPAWRETIRREGITRVEQALTELPLEFRLPLLLKDIAELSVNDVARILDLSVGTVKSRVHRARLRLRQALTTLLKQREPTGPTPYSQQVCLDLLAAKQAALDKGVEFSADQVVCERCRAVFATLDLGRDLCRALAEEGLPTELRAVLKHRLKINTSDTA